MLARTRLTCFAAIALLLAGSTPVRCADPSPLKPDAALAPQKEILAYASAHAIAIDRIELTSAAGEGKAGDAITALVTFRDRKGVKQWLAHFALAPATAKEEAGFSSSFNMAINGHEHKFTSGAPIAVEIRTIGPFSPGKPPPAAEKHARTLISPTFLGLGIDRACQAMLQMEAAAEKAKQSGAKSDAVLTSENERALAGLLPAMLAFFQGVQNTPGLNEILMEVVDKPSVWSVVKNRGINAMFNFDAAAVADAAEWGVTGQPSYRLPLNLAINDKPALRCALFVTNPRPPLLTSAGILGIVAESPSDPNRRVDIRVLAAHVKASDPSAGAGPP